jgi:hypothetical protein
MAFAIPNQECLVAISSRLTELLLRFGCYLVRLPYLHTMQKPAHKGAYPVGVSSKL